LASTGGIFVNLIFEDFSKICRENSSLLKIVVECNDYRFFPPGVKRPGRAVDHTPTSSPLGIHGLLYGGLYLSSDENNRYFT
jgi:hypothetical protein